MKKIHILIILFALSTPSIAQTDSTTKYSMGKQELEIIQRSLKSTGKENMTLTATELEDFRQSVENKVNELTNNIRVIGSKKESTEIRNKAVQNSMRLFIADAMMEVSNKKGTVKAYPMEDYFIRLMSLPYTKVEINFYDLAYISNFYKGQDEKYHATATIFQEFKGYTGENLTYTDRTSKTIDIILEYGEDAFFKVKRWIVKLGNIKVTETR